MSPVPEHAGKIILVVDDDAPVRNLVQSILTQAGYTVISAADGQKALELSRLYPGNIDLLISDIKMPRMSGPDLAEHLRLERPNTHVLLMSGYASGVLGEYAAATDFLEKPFVPKALITKVAEFLESSKSQGVIDEI
jgi:two-component system, cell cycle sensor histidine kinase and response regulator CckA